MIKFYLESISFITDFANEGYIFDRYNSFSNSGKTYFHGKIQSFLSLKYFSNNIIVAPPEDPIKYNGFSGYIPFNRINRKFILFINYNLF